MSKFTVWLQERLNAHGTKPSLGEDGAFGTATRSALHDFQASKGIRQGTANKETVEALASAPNSRSETKPVARPPSDGMPPWLAEMTRRMGLHEHRNHPELAAWLKSDGRTLGDPRKNPWCGDGAETCSLLTLPDEPVPTNPYWARNWEKYGRECSIRVGAICVIRWKRGGGHVGHVVDWKTDDSGKVIKVKLRGANQGDMIKDSWFSVKSRSGYVSALRWPKTYPLKKYKRIKGRASKGGGRKGTR